MGREDSPHGLFRTNPPPPGVQVFSFFITGRFAGHDNRNAFIQVLLEQLAEFLEQPLPQSLGEHTMEAHFRGMLADAAQVCEASGRRAVLVVDGLDEDRGVTSGPDAHSIAALLPSEPPAGLRLIVTTRPNPPTPSDVPDGHPLRTHGSAVRKLQPSHLAQVVRQDMGRELARLLDGTPEERDLLGLLTAARSGLSVGDLGQLTGWSERTTMKLLGSVAGRTFMPRSNRWNSDTASFILGHEELQVNAEQLIGRRTLATYVETLHSWADQFGLAQWPDDTSEYLVEGYPRLLQETGDVDRLISLSVDHKRHQWLSQTTGADAAGMEEIRRAQDLLLTSGRDDLASMTRLTFHADFLVERNRHTPADLPRLWSTLGRSDCAEESIANLSSPLDRANALVGLISTDEHFAAAGDRVVDLAARTLGPYDKADVLGRLALAVSETGNLQEAATIVARIEHDSLRFTVLLELLERSVVAGASETIAYLISHLPVGWPTTAAQPLILASDDLSAAEQLCAGISDVYLRTNALASVARVAVAQGEQAAARGIVIRMATDVPKVGDHYSRARLLIAIAGIETAIQRSWRLKEIVPHLLTVLEGIHDGMLITELAVSISGIIQKASDYGIAAEFRVLLSWLQKRVPPNPAIVGLVGAFESVETAHKLATSIFDLPERVKAMVTVAMAACHLGEPAHAHTIIGQVQDVLASAAQPLESSGLLRPMAKMAALGGDSARARRILDRIIGTDREQELFALVEYTAQRGQLETALEMADGINRVETYISAMMEIIVYSVRDNFTEAIDPILLELNEWVIKSPTLPRLIEEFANQGLIDRAQQLIAQLPMGDRKIVATARVVRSLAKKEAHWPRAGEILSALRKELIDAKPSDPSREQHSHRARIIRRRVLYRSRMGDYPKSRISVNENGSDGFTWKHRSSTGKDRLCCVPREGSQEHLGYRPLK